MEITAYLKSEQVRRDVAQAIDTREPTLAGTFPPLRTLEIRCQGAWSVVRFYCIDLNGPGIDGGAIRLYFRPNDDRFTVTDLGESVHALRLRTGMGIDEASVNLAENIGRDGTPYARNSEIAAYPTPDELPDAICHVLLAAYIVSNLDIKK